MLNSNKWWDANILLLCSRLFGFQLDFATYLVYLYSLLSTKSSLLLSQVKDQQEAERKKVASQEIQAALDEQTKHINAKQLSVREELAGVEPAVIEAKQGGTFIYFNAISKPKRRLTCRLLLASIVK